MSGKCADARSSSCCVSYFQVMLDIHTLYRSALTDVDDSVKATHRALKVQLQLQVPQGLV